MSDIIDVTWGEEPITTEKLQQMAQNDRTLRNLIPTTLFKSFGINKSTGVKMLAGTSIAQPEMRRWINTEVYFGNFFSVGCQPVVVVQAQSVTQRVITVGTHGLGKTPNPSHVGFHAYLYYNGSHGANGVIDAPITLNYIAIGW